MQIPDLHRSISFKSTYIPTTLVNLQKSETQNKSAVSLIQEVVDLAPRNQIISRPCVEEF